MKRFCYPVLAICAVALIGFHISKYYSQKALIINAKPEELYRFGKHFVIGYSSAKEMENLVSMGAVGGIYFSKKNIAGKSIDQIQRDIAYLQDLQHSFGRPPLFIATDQEGGIVSRFSPPLTKLPPLSYITADRSNAANFSVRASKYAAVQARELSQIGVNLNFSPVVDLKINHANRFNIHSRIDERAISDNPLIVSDIALAYSKTFERYGIFPTLKHFPGLGRVTADTHIWDAELNIDLRTLQSNDWLPFKTITEQTNAFVMLGHVKLNKIDTENPTSFSISIIQGILRDKWEFDGILITDDLGMGAIKHSGFTVEEASVKALNAGVDLLLISTGCHRYYSAVHAIIRAENEQRLNKELLMQSDKRLKKATDMLTRKPNDGKRDYASNQI